jgi:cell division transport system ATP-binding protein
MEYVAHLQNANIYQKNTQVLEDVHLSVSRAEFVYLIGKTGDGKSSLLKTLWAELPLLEGTGKVAGFDLARLTRKEIPLLRRKIGMVFQDFHLFKDWTVESNLRFVLEATGWKNGDKMNQRIHEVLSKVDLMHKLKEKAYKLSGGEQQRVVISRAMLNKPSLILADEPTGNLDPDTSDQILYLLRDFAIEHDTAVFMATHDYRVIEKFPGRVYQVANGRVEEID